jgi:hypothetical protein
MASAPVTNPCGSKDERPSSKRGLMQVRVLSGVPSEHNHKQRRLLHAHPLRPKTRLPASLRGHPRASMGASHPAAAGRP